MAKEQLPSGRTDKIRLDLSICQEFEIVGSPVGLEFEGILPQQLSQ